MSENVSLILGSTADEEHQNILRACSASFPWEAGYRLGRFRQTYDWQRLRVPGAPFADWLDYLRRGLGLSVGAAYQWMDAARLPLSCSEELGVDRTAWLARITDLTAVDETPEQAMALELPLAGGGTKPVRMMTVEEVERAYRLMRDEGASAGRAESGPFDAAARAVERTAASAVGQWLAAGQVSARTSGDKLLIDVRGVPQSEASDIFSALSIVLR